MNFILIQLIGILGILASCISFQCRKHKYILAFRTANEFIFALQYFMLGAYTGMAMNLVGCIRNIIFSEMVQKNKSTKTVSIIFSILFLIFTAVTWVGYKSILIGFAKVISTFAYGNPNTKVVRALILVTSCSWLIYNIMVCSYAGAVCELFTICSIIAGIIRIDLMSRSAKH